MFAISLFVLVACSPANEENSVRSEPQEDVAAEPAVEAPSRGVYARENAACGMDRDAAIAAYGPGVFLTLLPNEIAYYESRCRFGALVPGEDPGVFETDATCRGEGDIWERRIRIRPISERDADFIQEDGSVLRYLRCGD